MPKQKREVCGEMKWKQKIRFPLLIGRSGAILYGVLWKL